MDFAYLLLIIMGTCAVIGGFTVQLIWLVVTNGSNTWSCIKKGCKFAIFSDSKDEVDHAKEHHLLFHREMGKE